MPSSEEDVVRTPSTQARAAGMFLAAADIGLIAGLSTAALGNGFCLGILIYATAGISGGHLNPAVSTAFLMTNRHASIMMGLLSS